jgi:alpha-beta hydrolase superfamily lysophospholipase
MGEITHERRLLSDPAGWIACVSHTPPRRLVVFVHGFGGNGLKTWRRFSDSGSVSAWWRESDLLFVSYDSLRRTPVSVADTLRDELPRFFPQMPDDVRLPGGTSLRTAAGRYEQLYLVGHSLGGVVIRRALADVAKDWSDRRAADEAAPRPVLLEAELRLFSPASEGFRPAGVLGLAKALRLWSRLAPLLAMSAAYQDLQVGSPMLTATRERTQELVRRDGRSFAALRAPIVWADPENVVADERYDSDPVHFRARDTTHISVCKPNDGYHLPWVFVETGSVG